MRFSPLLISLGIGSLSGLASAVTSGGKYVLLDVPYTVEAGSAQSYTTPTGAKADPWSFSHGLLTLVQKTSVFSNFSDAQGHILRVNTPDGQLRGVYPVTWEAELSRTWRGRAWAYGGLNYACRLTNEGSVSFRLRSDQSLTVFQVYRVQGQLPGVSHRNTFSGGTLFSDDPVPARNPLLVEFSAPGWTLTGGGGSGYLENAKRAPSVCKTGFLPLLDQGGLDRSLSRQPLPPDSATRRGKQPLGQANTFYKGWTRAEIRTAFGSPDEPGTLAQLNTLDHWTYQGPMAEYYRFTFRNGRVVGTEERHMP